MTPEMLKSLIGGLVLDNLQLREENTRLKSMLVQASKGTQELVPSPAHTGPLVGEGTLPPTPTSSGS